MTDLVALPTQPADVPWPTEAWPVGDPPASVDQARLTALVDRLFEDPAPVELGHTNALVVVHRGRLVAEDYGTWFVSELEELDGKTATPITPDDVHLSWSMAKSVLHAVVGVLVRDGRIDPSQAPRVPSWTEADDPRRTITWNDLLQMRSGLQWVEEYYDFDSDALPDVVEMLYGSGHHDMAAFAAGFPLVHEPGSPEAYNYSSGTSNLTCAAAQLVVGDGEAGMRAFLTDELFTPIGMSNVRADFDDAGTFVASSYVYATPRDYARFGLLYLRDGVWDGKRIVAEGWVDHGRAPLSPDEEIFHGAHWWADNDDLGTFGAHGFEGQRILCVPALDLVLVRLGRTHADRGPTLDAHLMEIVNLFR
jgi:CubicO group peptidase (beta-lactamase class C family)